MATCYIVQEDDGTSRFILEDGSGFLILEDCVPTPSGDAVVMGGTQADVVAQRAARAAMERRMRRCRADEEDFLCLLDAL